MTLLNAKRRDRTSLGSNGIVTNVTKAPRETSVSLKEHSLSKRKIGDNGKVLFAKHLQFNNNRKTVIRRCKMATELWYIAFWLDTT